MKRLICSKCKKKRKWTVLTSRNDMKGCLGGIGDYFNIELVCNCGKRIWINVGSD